VTPASFYIKNIARYLVEDCESLVLEKIAKQHPHLDLVKPLSLDSVKEGVLWPSLARGK